MKNEHIPTWKTFALNIFLFLALPVGAYFLFDASGFTGWLLDTFPAPGIHHWNHPNARIPHLNKFIYVVCHSGIAHIFACASLHFLFNALGNLKCILTHHHGSGNGSRS